jgi:hypothetical protein
MFAEILLCLCIINDPFEYIPVTGPPSEELMELKYDNPELFEKKTHVLFAGERWRFMCVHHDEGSPEKPIESVNISMRSSRESRTDLWSTSSVVHASIKERGIFPVFERAYRFNRRLVVRGAEFEDVSNHIPAHMLPARGEACFTNGQIRSVERHPFRNVEIYVAFKPLAEGRFEPISFWSAERPRIWPGEPTTVLKVGGLLKIADGATLKVTRIVPPQSIKNVGNLVGWVCFEDVEHAAEQRRKKNGEEPKTAAR